MKTKLIRYGIFGFSTGIAIGYVITLIISICIKDGLYYPVRPELINMMGNELNATLLQTLFTGIVGMGFSMASIVWEIDSLSLAKQSVIYFLAACISMFPIAYYANWMPHSIVGALIYVSIFLVIFVLVWIIRYFIYKKNIKELNDKIG